MTRAPQRSGPLVRAGALLAALLSGCDAAPAAPDPPGVPPAAASAPTATSWDRDVTRFRPAARPAHDGELARRIEALQAIGYVAGSRPAGDPGAEPSGVTFHDASASFAGLNLAISGHRAEARLFDMAGRELHRWQLPFERAFPERAPDPAAPGTGYWRRVHLLPDGSLLAIYEGQGLVRVDRDSRRLWAWPGAAHHDLDVTRDGRLFVLDRVARVNPSVHPSEPILEDYLVELGLDGSERHRVSILAALQRSEHAALLEAGPRSGDLLHTNTVEILDGSLAGRLPAFGAGRALISLRELDAIAVLDPGSGRIVWAWAGPWRRQHQPSVLGNGHLLVFDNDGDAGVSRVLEVDPQSRRIAGVLRGREHGFDSPTCGSSQRLPNGNTLVTESDAGRALEFTPDGRLVWAWATPHRAGERGELVATLFELIRIPRAELDWLEPAAERLLAERGTR